MARFYALAVQFALDLPAPGDSDSPTAPRRTSAATTLMREWGRIGSPGTIRHETHPSLDAALAAMHAYTARKRRRGYR
jgi:predicted DNA-binding WGR domain protein